MAKRVLVIGAAGKVGQRVVPRLAAAGHTPIAMYRKDDQEHFLKERGAIPLRASLTDISVDDLSKHMEGIDEVIFSAGAGGVSIELIDAIDGEGLRKSVRAAEQAGVKRFVHVSAYPKSWREEPYSDTFEHYFYVKKETDVFLTQSKLDWVIIRPVALSDDPGIGRITAGLAVSNGVVRRDDVATALVTIINHKELSHKIIEITEGEEPIESAINRMT